MKGEMRRWSSECGPSPTAARKRSNGTKSKLHCSKFRAILGEAIAER